MFCSHCSHTKVEDRSTDDRMEEDQYSHEQEENTKLPESHPVVSSGTCAGSGRTWWVADDCMDRMDRQPDSGCPRWRFGSISFPDLGSNESLPSCLLPPDPSLLPGSLAVGVCDVNPWRQRINLRVVMSSKDQKRGGDKHRCRWDINHDREVCSVTSNLYNY